jgi:hypothetical protein
MTVAVLLGDHELKHMQLKRGVYEMIEIDSPRAEGDVIASRVSERIQESEQREVSFLLQATNIFGR